MNQTKKRILIVENDEDTLFLMQRLLGDAGYEVEASAAGGGLVEFKHEVPDLYILDQGLPTVDGIALSKFLRLQDSSKDIPIIMISGYPVEGRAKLAGIDEFVKKPFTKEEVLDAVRRQLAKAAQGVPET